MASVVLAAPLVDVMASNVHPLVLAGLVERAIRILRSISLGCPGQAHGGNCDEDERMNERRPSGEEMPCGREEKSCFALAANEKVSAKPFNVR